MMENFSKKMFFLEMILWTRRVEFRQPCRKVFARRPKLFCSLSESRKKFEEIQNRLCSSNYSAGHGKSSFEDPVKFFEQKLKKNQIDA